jgi:hypothetical protein
LAQRDFFLSWLLNVFLRSATSRNGLFSRLPPNGWIATPLFGYPMRELSPRLAVPHANSLGQTATAAKVQP